MKEENLKELADIYNELKRSKDLLADIAEEEQADLDQADIGIDDALDNIWEHIEDYCVKGEV